MSDWQLLYLVLLCAATAGGWGQRWLLGLMWANFAATYLWRTDVWTVATADILCAVLLIGRGWRANVVAGLFIAMVPVYLMGAAFQWHSNTTYAIIDAIAYLQCGVVGRVDRGGLRLVGWLRRAGGSLRIGSGRALSPARAVGIRRDAQKGS